MKLLRTRLTLAVLLISAVLTVAACHPNVTYETPKAAAAVHADDVVVRLNELQATLIQACGPAVECAADAGFSTSTFREIVKALIDIRTTLKAAPDGWLASTRAGWAQLKPRLVGVTNPAIAAAFGAVDAVLGGL